MPVCGFDVEVARNILAELEASLSPGAEGRLGDSTVGSPTVFFDREEDSPGFFPETEEDSEASFTVVDDAAAGCDVDDSASSVPFSRAAISCAALRVPAQQRSRARTITGKIFLQSVITQRTRASNGFELTP